MTNKGYLLALFIFAVTSLNAQPDWKNWYSAQLEFRLTRKMDFQVGHLRSYELSNNYNNDFNQTSLRITYDIAKKFSLAGGVVINGTGSSTEGKNRVLLRGTYKARLGKVLSWSNSIQGELHSSSEKRYRERIILITRLGTRERLDFMRLSPSVSYYLFYNIGGDPIQYYDSKTGDPVVQNTPDGFHRGRLRVNLNTKITKRFSASLYYMMQKEFNLFTDEYHRINVLNPLTGTVARRFDDYHVIGLSFEYEFKLYNNKK